MPSATKGPLAAATRSASRDHWKSEWVRKR